MFTTLIIIWKILKSFEVILPQNYIKIFSRFKNKNDQNGLHLSKMPPNIFPFLCRRGLLLGRRLIYMLELCGDFFISQMLSVKLSFWVSFMT